MLLNKGQMRQTMKNGFQMAPDAGLRYWRRLTMYLGCSAVVQAKQVTRVILKTLRKFASIHMTGGPEMLRRYDEKDSRRNKCLSLPQSRIKCLIPSKARKAIHASCRKSERYKLPSWFQRLTPVKQ